MKEKKYIHVTSEVRAQLCQEFNLTKCTVWRALAFDKTGPASERVRIRAYQLGGVLINLGDQTKVLYDHDGMMVQYLPNGTSIQCNLKNSHVDIVKEGDVVESFDKVYMSQLPAIQAKALAL